MGTILNDDGPVLRISDVSQTEGNAGTITGTRLVSAEEIDLFPNKFHKLLNLIVIFEVAQASNH